MVLPRVHEQWIVHNVLDQGSIAQFEMAFSESFVV